MGRWLDQLKTEQQGPEEIQPNSCPTLDEKKQNTLVLATDKTDKTLLVGFVGAKSVDIQKKYTNPENHCNKRMSRLERDTIEKWLDHIGETDVNQRRELFSRCAADKKIRDFFLHQAEEILSIKTEPSDQAKCQDCQHFNLRLDDGSLGSCSASVKPNQVCLLASDTMSCDKYKSIALSHTFTPEERKARQPQGNEMYLTDSGLLIDVGELLDTLLFICKDRSIAPSDIGRYLTQDQLDDWHEGELSSVDLKCIADELETGSGT